MSCVILYIVYCVYNWRLLGYKILKHTHTHPTLHKESPESTLLNPLQIKYRLKKNSFSCSLKLSRLMGHFIIRIYSIYWSFTIYVTVAKYTFYIYHCHNRMRHFKSQLPFHWWRNRDIRSWCINCSSPRSCSWLTNGGGRIQTQTVQPVTSSKCYITELHTETEQLVLSSVETPPPKANSNFPWQRKNMVRGENRKTTNLDNKTGVTWSMFH